MKAQERKTAKMAKIYLSYLRPQLAQNQLGINWSWVNAGQKFKGNLNYQSEDMSDSVTKEIIFQQHVPFWELWSPSGIAMQEMQKEVEKR